MANLDTPLKRLSGIAHTSPWRWSLPLPDGAISQADRQTVAFLYSGILATPPAPPPTAPALQPRTEFPGGGGQGRAGLLKGYAAKQRKRILADDAEIAMVLRAAMPVLMRESGHGPITITMERANDEFDN